MSWHWVRVIVAFLGTWDIASWRAPDRSITESAVTLPARAGAAARLSSIRASPARAAAHLLPSVARAEGCSAGAER